VYNLQTIINIYSVSRMCMATIFYHYQSLFCFKDWYGYNIKTTTNHYYVFKLSMAIISRPLLIIIMYAVSRIGMGTIFRPLPIFILCLG
jgi:hypothetical protein